jgi:putative membrane protein
MQLLPTFNLKTSRTSLLIAVVLTLAAGIAHAQAGLNDLQIAHAAYTADVIDIEYAKIALAKTKNPEVRQFAELMIRDHTAVNEGAAALLTKLKVHPEDNAFSQALNSGAKARELNSMLSMAWRSTTPTPPTNLLITRR